MFPKFYSLISIISLSFLIYACGNNDNDTPIITSSDYANIRVSLLDAPADYDSVIIDIQNVEIKLGDSSSWQSLNGFTPGLYDLLLLTNGEELELGDADVPQDTLKEIRLILGDGNYLVIDSTIHDLKVPSGSQSGLKIKLNEYLIAGVTYNVVLDFDAAKSVVKAGNSGKYNLKPVIRASLDALTGAIVGIVSPDTANAVIYAINSSSDTFSTYPDSTGGFMIRSLDPDTYDLIAEPDTASGFSPVSLNGVSVTAGLVTDVDTLKF